MNEQTDLIQYTKKRSLCRRLLPLLLAMGLLLVGCSGGTEPSEPSSDTGSSTASASSTPAASAPEPEPEPETLEQELLKKRGVAFDQSDYKTFTGAEGVLSLQTVFSDLNPKKAGGNLSSVFLSGGKIYQYRCDATLPGGDRTAGRWEPCPLRNSPSTSRPTISTAPTWRWSTGAANGIRSSLPATTARTLRRRASISILS